MSILNESQKYRDFELACLLSMTEKQVENLPIATPDAIRVSDGNKPENLEDLYHDYEHLNFPAYLRTLMKTSATRRHSELFKLLRETENKTCLDFGSGVGTHAIALLENGNSVVALDVPGKLQQFTIDRVAWRGHDDKTFIAVYNDVRLRDEMFDVVICSDTLEHVNDPIKELDRIRNSMKIGGIIHLLVSTMVKPSSGHFPESIAIWKTHGQDYLNAHFKKIGDTLYKRKK